MPKILIADDSIAVRKVAERLLTEAGMGVTLAANGLTLFDLPPARAERDLAQWQELTAWLDR